MAMKRIKPKTRAFQWEEEDAQDMFATPDGTSIRELNREEPEPPPTEGDDSE